MLSATAARLLRGDDPQGIVEDLCRQVMDVLDCQAFLIFLKDDKTGRLRLNARAGIPLKDARRIERLDPAATVCGCIAREGRRIVVEDILNGADPRTDLMKSFGFQAVCCHPLLAQGRVLGTLSFATRSRPRFGRDEVAMMEAVAGLAAIALFCLETHTALGESEAKFRTLFDSMGEGYVLCEVIFDPGGRPGDVHFLEANPAATRMFGHDLTGRRLTKLRLAAGAFWLETLGGIAQTGRAVRAERFVDALKIWIDFNAFKVGGKDSRRIMAVFQDVTARKRRELNAAFMDEVNEVLLGMSSPTEILPVVGEKAARHYGASLRLSINEMDEARDEITVHYDHHAPGRPDVSRKCRLSDLRADSLLPELKAGRIVAIDDISADPRMAGEAGAQYRACGVRAEMLAPFAMDRHAVFVLAIQHDEPHAWRPDEIELARELTARLSRRFERARAEEALRQKELELRDAQRVARLGNWYWNPLTDGDEGRSSEGFMRIFGLDPGRPLPPFRAARGILFSPEDWDRVYDAGQQTMKTGLGSGLDVAARRADGRAIWISMRFEPARDAEGTIVGIHGTVQDITERKRAEDALREADRRKNEFLAMLAHELRNPLAAITSAVDVMRYPDASGPMLERARDAAARQAEHMRRLVDDLLDVSRITRGIVNLKQEVVAVSDVIHTAVDGMRPMTEPAGHRFTLSLPVRPLHVAGDPVRLAQIVSNLISNAAKFTPSDGEISLTVEPEDGEVAIRVRDKGIGIGPDLLPHVFDLFVQGEHGPGRIQSGLGIGLTMVKRLAEMHGGRVAAESAGPGQGSEFTVWLPLIETPSTGRRAPGTADASTPPRRVLVVDDNLDEADLLAMLLRGDGHEVAVANSGPAALAVGPAFKPEVVLLDLGMPGMDGYETARRMRAMPELAGVRLVARTGYGGDDDRARTRAVGFDDHVVKPTDMAMLRQLLRG